MLLETITTPQDLRKLSFEQLPVLAAEIRQRIVEVVSQNGGHLASSLGAVELAISLHYCLDTPNDKLIWDVGHQAYAHKMLTSRNKNFHTLRQVEGLSAFCCKDESCYDTFTSGHSSTAVSLALGLVAGQTQDSPAHKVVAVIGDGSLSGGLCFEGLNNAGHLARDLTIILNTNELSISPNVGAISTYLNKLISLPIYNRFRTSLEGFVKTRLPKGSRLLKIANKFEEGLKGLFIPGMLFEELGFRYFGPFDGNNCAVIVPRLKNILSLKGPKIIHVFTKKGKGYPPAESEPIKFHSTPPFDIATGQPKAKDHKAIYTEVFSNKLLELARADKRIVAITAAMPEGTGLDKFQAAYPARFFDVGIAEAHAVCFAAGLVNAGLRPVVAIYSTFLQRAYDQIIEEVALQKLPVVFAIDRAGIISGDGPTHQGIFDIAFLRSVPDFVVMAPSCAEELEHMLEFAFTLDKPAAIRYPKDKAAFCKHRFSCEKIRPGVPEVVHKGADAVVLALGSMVLPCLDAAEMLKAEGISLRVVNARFAKPLDKEELRKVTHDMQQIFTAEEGIIEAGFGSAVWEIINKPLHRIGLPNVFLPTSARDLLLQKLALDAVGIYREIKSVLKNRTHA